LKKLEQLGVVQKIKMPTKQSSRNFPHSNRYDLNPLINNSTNKKQQKGGKR
jgi:hypothetical protein